MTGLKPFWWYYGGKWRAAKRYPVPTDTIVEPFAGAAGYSLRYADRRVVLVEKYPVVAEIWRWLIGASRADVIAIPCVDHVDDLPARVPEGARALVGFCMNAATTAPRKSLSSGALRLREMGRHTQGWTDKRRAIVASQVEQIRHWRVIEGDYTQAPDIPATWFVDPPYDNRAGRYYVHHDIDYPALGDWCRTRRGQVIACENEGATWLPFKPFATFSRSVNGKGSREVIWTNQQGGGGPVAGKGGAE